MWLAATVLDRKVLEFYSMLWSEAYIPYTLGICSSPTECCPIT